MTGSSASTTPATATSQWPPRRPSKRSKLRNGTFIIPATGERSRRVFTLRSARPDPTEGPNGSESVPPWAGSSVSSRSRSAADTVLSGTMRFLRWLDTPTGHGVLKCTLAYTIASLATFWAPLSEFLGKPDGKHVVATITVYFHPARSAGSMIEAVLIALVAVTYAEVVSVLSMCTSILFGTTFALVPLAHALVLVLFIGGGLGCIGWVKQRMNNPLVDVGSTLASLAIIGVVTKETAVYSHVFSNVKIVQIFKMLIMGISITTAVNLVVWRVSAVGLLRESMTKASGSLGEMLALISRGFLSGSEEELNSAEFAAASTAYSAVYPQMAKNLREAKFERYLVGHEKLYQLDRAVVRSMETLAQSIGGLRSAANTQFGLLRESMFGCALGSPRMSPGWPTDVTSPHSPSISPNMQRTLSAVLKSGKDRFLTLSSIDEASNESSTEDERPNEPSTRSGGPPTFNNPSDILEHFITLLGPSMKSLAFTLSEVLRDPPFGSSPDYEIKVNDQFRHSLTEAVSLFNEARANALQELYDTLELGRTRTEKIQADFEEVAAACGHFSFSLQTFGEEMQKYLDVLDDLKYASLHKTRSWNWMKWWRHGKPRDYVALPYDTEERDSLIKPIKKRAMPRGVADTMVRRRDTYNWDAAPQASKFVATVSQKLLRLLRRMASDEIRFGLKVGLGAAMWASLSFIPQTREIYQHWRGEWGLLSFMIVCAMTVGASNTVGFARFFGTLVGVGCTLVNWNVTQGNAVGLMLMGWFVAFWGFWMIVARGKAPLGRITLLAYNVSTLYAYSLSQSVDDDDDDEGGVNPIIIEIVRHRFFAVTAGILWGLVVCRLVWPISARKKFKEGLAMLHLQMGLIWKRGPLAMLLRSDANRSYLRSGEQAALAKYAARLDALRASAASEFELRGPFPADRYGRLMACTHRILDAFYAMSLVTQRKGGRLTDGERALLLYTAGERAQLCDRICHVFQVLASSLMLEYPLTDALPSVVGTRDRLLGKIFQFRKEHSRPPSAVEGGEAEWSTAGGGGGLGPLAEVNVMERDYALLYAYALVTGQVAEELRVVAKEIEGLFGVLGEDALLLQ